MNSDLLLYWMTHVREGSWDAFKRAIVRMTDDAEDADGIIVAVRFHLSDLGFVNFFTEGSRRWRVLPPTLAGVEPAGAAILIGGRTPRLQDHFLAAAQRLDCQVSLESNQHGPTTLRVNGDDAILAQLAAHTGVTFSQRHAQALSAQLTPLFKSFEDALDEIPPTNWLARSFDFESMSMVDGLRRNSACEYSPRRGLSRWYVHTRRGRLRSLPKRDAIYVAAMLQDVKLLSFEVDSSTLLSASSTPLPEVYARVACLCGGRRPSITRDSLVYRHVPSAVASVLCVASGQPSIRRARTARQA